MVSLFAKLLAFQFLGELLMRTLSTGIPGSFIGIVLMLLYLFKRHGEAEKLVPACHRLLNQLALVVSTFASIIVTAGVLHRLRK